MSKMRAAQVSRAGRPFELVEREIPQPTAGQVRIKVQACSGVMLGFFGVGGLVIGCVNFVPSDATFFDQYSR